MKTKQPYFDNKFIYLVALFLILLVGTILRTYKLVEWMPWNEDFGRDMTVVHRMITDGVPHKLSVTSGDSSGFVVNSPLYFWITAMLYMCINSPIGIAILYAVWNIAGIVFCFYIGKIYGDRLLGLLYASLIGCSYILVTYSQYVWQPTIIPTLTILSVLILQLTLKKTNPLWVFILINISFLGVHFYYGFYPILIINTLWILLSIIKTSKKNILLSLLYLVNYFVHICVWGLIVNSGNKMNQIHWLQLILNSISFKHYLVQLQSIFNEFATYTFFNQNQTISSFIIIFLFSGLIYYTVKEKNNRGLVVIITSYISTILLIGFYKDPINTPRLSIYFPLILLGIGYLIKKISLQNIIIYILISGYILYLVSNASWSYLFNSPPNQFYKTELLSHALLQDYYLTCGKECPIFPSFRIYSVVNVGEESDWYTGQYWYFLEQLTGKKLVSLVNTGNNIKPFVNEPKVRYLICPIMAREVNRVKKTCIREYIKKYNHLADYSYRRINLEIEDLNNLYIVYKWNFYEAKILY